MRTRNNVSAHWMLMLGHKVCALQRIYSLLLMTVVCFNKTSNLFFFRVGKLHMKFDQKMVCDN